MCCSLCMAYQYSMFYLTNRYTPGKLPKDDPVHQFIPLVEFAFDTPHGEKTAATMNPGLAYVAGVWQVAAEAIVPLNSEGGRTIGMRAHLFLFLDDLIPAVFGKPLLESMTQARSNAGGRRCRFLPSSPPQRASPCIFRHFRTSLQLAKHGGLGIQVELPHP
jgi:hypothetical protein